MSFFRSSLYLVSLFILALSVSACSNTPPQGEESTTDGALPAPESGADQVGSIPEDMLADERGIEGSSGESPSSSEEATAEADPFSDLKENDEEEQASTSSGERDALVVPESEKTEPSSSGSGQMERYTVKSGDTLMKIAFSLYGDVERWKEIQELNSAALKGKETLRKGMQLRYEAPVETFSPDEHAKAYEIKKGDTLAGIADEVYGRKMKYRKLQGYNKQLIKNPNRIFAGFTIFYDITEQEMAEADARRAERLAKEGGNSTPPSAISPPPEAAPPPKNMASDNSALQGPTSSGTPPPAE